MSLSCAPKSSESVRDRNNREYLKLFDAAGPTPKPKPKFELPHILSDPDFELPDFEINCAVYTIRGRFFIGSASFWCRSGSWSCISFMRPLSWMSSTFIEEMAQALKDRGLFAIWGKKKVNPYRDNHPPISKPDNEPALVLVCDGSPGSAAPQGRANESQKSDSHSRRGNLGPCRSELLEQELDSPSEVPAQPDPVQDESPRLEISPSLSTSP